MGANRNNSGLQQFWKLPVVVGTEAVLRPKNYRRVVEGEDSPASDMIAHSGLADSRRIRFVVGIFETAFLTQASDGMKVARVPSECAFVHGNRSQRGTRQGERTQ